VLVPPSPNVHEWFVIDPVEVSVKVTFSGAAPLVGLAVKLELGEGEETQKPLVLAVRGPVQLLVSTSAITSDNGGEAQSGVGTASEVFSTNACANEVSGPA